MTTYNTTFTGFSGKTIDLSTLTGLTKRPSINIENVVPRLFGSTSEFPYTYTVQACTQPLLDEIITYVVGSETELITGLTYSFQSLQNPSVTVCGEVVDDTPIDSVEYSMVNTYIDCGEAFINNYKLVTVEDCYFPNFIPNIPVWIVDKKYEVGDILYIDKVLDIDDTPTGRTFYKFAAQIKTDENWVIPFPVWEFLPSINYVPYSSCEEAVESNGLIYGAGSCSEMEVTYPLIHKAIYGPTVLPIPTGNNPVKVLFNYYPYGPYEYISGGTPEIYSFINLGDVITENYEDLCSLGLTNISPEGVLNGNFLNTGFDGDLVYTMVEQPDGKILVGGNFNQYLEVNVGNFMRINPDGSLDETFYLGQFNSYIRAIALQPDGKILVGGNFTNYDGYNAGRIIRLNSDGTIDGNFTYGPEFDGKVRAIAVQRDGKIVVGGDFNNYYNFYCPQIVRLNSNGTPDTTFVMGQGFDGDQVFTITTEIIRNNPFYVTNGTPTYTENIIVGGWFTWYNGTTVRGIVKLSPTGEVLPDFGEGFNVNEGGSPRVNQILTQPDGKLVVIGGADGGYLRDYNDTWIPNNIIRLVKENNTYVIDTTFSTRNWDDNGGFNRGALSISLLPNGKYMVGGQFDSYGDNNTTYETPKLIRLNSNGTLDETFTFILNDNNVNKVLLLSSGRLLVGGWFQSPMDLMLELFIGEEYVLRSFDTCDGLTSNIFIPTSFEPEYAGGSLENVTELPYSPISKSGLDIVYEEDSDDDNFTLSLPTPFDINFLGVNYTNINVSSNSFIVFGDAGNTYEHSPCCFEIPNEIPTLQYGDDDHTNLPGVFISTNCGDGEIDNGLDNQLYFVYTGLTDGGNTMIVKYEGSYHCDESGSGSPDLIYNFKFYKDNSDYFDLIIEQNTKFYNNDPTGGVSDGVNPTWISSFDSSSEKAYRISGSSTKPIKANVNERPAVCGTVGEIINTPQSGGTGLSIFTLFTVTDLTTYNSCSDCGQLYNATLSVTNSLSNDTVRRVSLTKESIENIQNFGPYFTTTMSNIPTPEVFYLLTHNL
jgi:uncharacterized delta-60 repeat protein